LLQIGLLVYGFCIQYKSTLWVGALLGMGIGCFGIQVITTTCYTYSIECYRPEGSEVSLLFNFVRQEFGMTFAFYAILLGDRIGYQFLFVLFAALGSVVAFLPVLALMRWGQVIREHLGRPRNVNVWDMDGMADDEGDGERGGERKGERRLESGSGSDEKART
jgi:hypothetical protein